MTTWKVPPPHTMPRCREDVEADVRVLMTKMAAIEARGFDSIKAREILHRRVDVLLDEHSLFVAIESLTETP